MGEKITTVGEPITVSELGKLIAQIQKDIKEGNSPFGEDK